MEMLTTGEAGTVLQVSSVTIRRYMDEGKLKGERFPEEGSHRRIKREDLIAFAQQYNLTLDWSRLSQ